ncbi:MAG: hypothetical protein AAFX52_11070 [Pseudomonadota bacterium]
MRKLKNVIQRIVPIARLVSVFTKTKADDKAVRVIDELTDDQPPKK